MLAKRPRGLSTLSLLVIVIVAIAAIFANVINDAFLDDPYRPDFSLTHSPPWPLTADGREWHASRPLGSDRLGRDLLSRLILGARLSMAVAGTSILIAVILGTILGHVSGYLGGPLDGLLMRTVDLMLAFPIILIALLFVTTVGASFWMVVTIISFVLSAHFARVVRGDVITWKNSDFVALARVAGASPVRIMVHHILPNVMNSIIVLATIQIGWVIIIEASLSFLGAGIPPPQPTWGNMVADGRQYIDSAWWVSVLPGVAIMVTVVAFNMLGDWLRDSLDPRLRQL